MIFVLFHVLYSLSKYLFKNYAGKLDVSQEMESLKQESCEMRNAVCNEDAALLNTQLKFSPPAYIQRYNQVVNVLADPKYEGKLQKVVDFGCSELGFLIFLKNCLTIEEILCVDIDEEILEMNSYKAKPFTMDYINRRMTPLTIEICKGSVIQNDIKLQNTDAVICIELIEHMYLNDLIDFPYNIFEYIRPKVAVITTPNADFNVLFPDFSGYRHSDHKFEWTREQFQDWAQNIVTRYPSYSVTFHGIGDGPEGTEQFGSCSQMAVFHLESQEEFIQIPGTILYKTVARFDYPVHIDSRSDEQKIVDEAVYYINFLSYEIGMQSDEISLERVLSFMKNSITIETLKSILIQHGMTIEDREDGAVVLPFEHSTTNDSADLSDVSEHDLMVDIVDDNHHNDFSMWNETDFGSHSSVCEADLRADEESLLLQVPRVNDWNEECSIVIPQNRSVVLENTYLFDGEVSLADEFRVSEQPTPSDDINHLAINDAAEGLASESSIPLILNNKKFDGKTQIIQSDALTFIFSAVPSTSSASKNTTKKVDIVMIEPALSEEDELNLRSMQKAAPTLHCQPHLSISRSSTSPEPLYRSFELDNSLQNNSTNQNEFYQDEFSLNNTFRQSEMNEAVENVEFVSESVYGLEENPSQEDYSQENKINLLENASNAEVNNSCNIERVDIIPIKKRICRDIAHEVSSNTCSSNFENQPKFTSSPRKISALLRKKYFKSKNLVPADSDTTSNRTEAIKNTVLDIDNSSLANTQISSSVVGTIDVCTTSSNSNDIDKNTASKHSIDCSINNKTQQGLCSKNKEFSTSISTENEGTNREFATESNIINHETDADNVQNILSLVDAIAKYEEERNVISASKPDDVNAKAYLDVLASDSQTNISKRCLSPPREFLSSKSQRNSKYSSECAKEVSILENKFIPCSSSENTSNVQFASMSRNEENVGNVVTKEPTTRDVDMSNIARLVDNLEAAKAPSPLETPPNSWSPEIMDSGYPNTASAQDITPEYDLSSIAQDHIPDSESPSVAEEPRFGFVEVLEPIEVENGDLANNNRDDEGNNMMAVDADDNEDLQPFIHVLENDLENENDIYVMQNGFPRWLLRILDMGNPLGFERQARQHLRAIADDINYANRDEGFDSSSSESDIVYNENDNERDE